MKIGVSAFAWTSSFRTSHLDLLPRVREYGLDALEIPMFEPAQLPAAALRKAFKHSGLECTVCAILPAGINPISPDGAVRARSRAHLGQCVETTAEMGAHLLAGPMLAPIGYLPGRRPAEDEWMWAVEACQSVVEALEKNAIVMAVEPVNRSETFFVRTAADAKRLCEAVERPQIAVTIDTFHANIEEKSIEGAIDLLGPRLKHMHMSENDRGILGSGHIDFASIVNALKRNTYDGYLMIEGFGRSKSEPAAPGWLWAEELVTPEDIAVQGLRFLKQVVEA